MDYTKNEELMRILSELAHEVKGWEYTVGSKWKDNESVVASRRETLNELIDHFKQYIKTQ
jgi:type II secretory pathway component PulL